MVDIYVSLCNRCPVCRREIAPSISAEDFPRNRAVENMIENMNKLSFPPTVSLIATV